MSELPLLDHLSESAQFHLLHERFLEDSREKISLHGLAGSLKAFVLAHLKKLTPGPLLSITADEEEAEQLRDDLVALLGEERVRYFPAIEILPGERLPPHKEAIGLRVEALYALLSSQDVVVVTTAVCLISPALPPDFLSPSLLSLSIGDLIDVEEFIGDLVDTGFESVTAVEEVGQISHRGGIIDIYSFGSDSPVRVEFFGDQVESIRLFDPSSQRSVKRVEHAFILPAREIIFLKKKRDIFLDNVHSAGLPAEHTKLLEANISSGILFDGMEAYMAALYGKGATPTAYLSPATAVFLDDPEGIAGAIERQIEKHAAEAKRQRERKEGITIFDCIGSCRLIEHHLFHPPEDDHLITFGGVEGRFYQRNLDLLKDDIRRLANEAYRLDILCESRSQAERLSELLDDLTDLISIGVGNLHRGFLSSHLRVAVINDHEIFGRYRRHFRFRRFKGATPVKSFTALQRGDYVVHIDHGIGQYRGIVKLTVDGKARDCLLLFYRDGDKLYVPVEQLDRVQKYSVEESAPPALNKLGGSGWERLKQQTKQAIFEMAEELVTLYAERKSRPGYAFSPDTQWQKELEASFIYQETPDQLTATADVKRDLERPVPMDRLICGDVGYGKTEVAIRAAFKVLQDGKQVALLVPTTILAQQHYETFHERISPFPIRVEVLSRFRTPKEQEVVIKGIRDGSVDIVIGTHRLLSEDVRFKTLGLVIIDEEQRFGVRHKEKLKHLRRQVDVMAMTATPIPRTLHMALLGTRDMSIINTPPKDRLPIYTEILPFNEDRIAEAILREVDRGGQVYFVHNRVQSIDSMAEFLHDLLPQVRFAVAHGQMQERQLERIMLDFLARRYDCLIATMIIESGLDIPNVNTIIINRADRFGLSQLYQIRGRVGRSNRRAYAYLIIPPRKNLPRTAQRRLFALEEFSDLGSGFSIAMRDLEIRGAGNLLGAQQHGFIVAVGFDLYCRLLDEAIHQLKGEDIEQIPDPDLHIVVSAYLPDDYVLDAGQKIELYQRLATAKNTAAVLEIEEEMRDRYGRFPPQVAALLNLIHIKILAKHIRAIGVDVDDIRLRITLPQNWQPSRQKIEDMVRRSPTLLSFSFGKEPTIEASLEGNTDYERLEFAKITLQEIL